MPLYMLSWNDASVYVIMEDVSVYVIMLLWQDAYVYVIREGCLCML